MESMDRHAKPVSSGDVPNGEPTFQPKTCDICFCEKAEHDCIRCALALCNGCGDRECDVTNRNPHLLTPRVIWKPDEEPRGTFDTGRSICSPRTCARCGATIEDGESPAAARSCQWCKRLICSYDCTTAHEQECAWQQPSSSDSEENWVAGTRPRRARERGAAGRPPEGQDAEGRTIYTDHQPTATVEASELRSMLSYREPLACRDGSGTTTPLGEAVAGIFGLKPALPGDAGAESHAPGPPSQEYYYADKRT